MTNFDIDRLTHPAIIMCPKWLNRIYNFIYCVRGNENKDVETIEKEFSESLQSAYLINNFVSKI
jgi:hypothetical protein